MEEWDSPVLGEFECGVIQSLRFLEAVEVDTELPIVSPQFFLSFLKMTGVTIAESLTGYHSTF